jgi:hypothetical protein
VEGLDHEVVVGRLSSFLCLTSVSHAAASASNRASKSAFS